LTRANLNGANLRGAKLDMADTQDATFCNTVNPNGWRLYTGC